MKRGRHYRLIFVDHFYCWRRIGKHVADFTSVTRHTKMGLNSYLVLAMMNKENTTNRLDIIKTFHFSTDLYSHARAPEETFSSSLKSVVLTNTVFWHLSVQLNMKVGIKIGIRHLIATVVLWLLMRLNTDIFYTCITINLC